MTWEEKIGHHANQLDVTVLSTDSVRTLLREAVADATHVRKERTQLDDAEPDSLPPPMAPGSLGIPNIEGTQFRGKERHS